MKNVRFRAKKDGRVYDGSMVFLNSESDSGSASLNTTLLNLEEGYDLLLYTGINDRKGIPIFEGDSLKFGTPVVVEYDPSYAAFVCRHPEGHRVMLGMLKHEELEVIP